MIDVSELMSDPDFVSELTVLRRVLTMTAGVASYAETPEVIYGAVQPATGEDAPLLPEGIQLGDAIKVFTSADLRALGPAGAADVLVWNGRRYTVAAVPAAFRSHGYNAAVAVGDALSGIHDAE